ncbi:hypothetical protein ANN_19630 [Periplaneta americana]|uniref:HAT C-terminal dimerisation domain-containing protein n=1 Tax=Periplaneta americana TaxID=6978 RepID=A0ABQ8SAF2_PERAM|nr:hypothetical protein ANN_19630 [Periplaneta americana]
MMPAGHSCCKHYITAAMLMPICELQGTSKNVLSSSQGDDLQTISMLQLEKCNIFMFLVNMIRRKRRVSVCVSVRVSVMYGMSGDDEDEEGRRGNLVPACSLLLSNSTKRPPDLITPSDGQITINIDICLLSYALRRDLGFNPGILVHNLGNFKELMYATLVQDEESPSSPYFGRLQDNTTLSTDTSAHPGFNAMGSSFPEKDLNVCVKLFPVLDKDKPKTELTVLYQKQEFRNISDAVNLLQFLLSENLQASFSEVVKLLHIAITTPMTTSQPERCFSCVKRSLMLAGSEFQSLGRAIVKEDEYEEVRWDGIVSNVSWRDKDEFQAQNYSEAGHRIRNLWLSAPMLFRLSYPGTLPDSGSIIPFLSTYLKWVDKKSETQH